MRLLSSRGMENGHNVSSPKLLSVWSASISRCQLRSATTATAAGRTQHTAISTNTARTAYASSRAQKSSHSVGHTTARSPTELGEDVARPLATQQKVFETALGRGD